MRTALDRVARSCTRPVRLGVVCGFGLGAALAGFTAVLAGAGWPPFALASALLAALTIATLRRQRWAILLDFGLVGLQPIGVVGAAIELAAGGSDKSVQLAGLGVDPRWGLVSNLLFAALLSTVFLFWLRLLHPARTRSQG